MVVQISPILAPISFLEIKAFEQKIGSPLPEDYHDFLLKYNGGLPNPNCIDANDWGETIVQVIYGLGSGVNSLEKNFEVFQNRIPKEFIPFASDWLGNQLIIGILGDRFGKCYLWYHEAESSQDGIPEYDNIYLISDDFNSFLEGLYEDDTPIPPISEIERQIRAQDYDAIKKAIDSGWDVNSSLEYGMHAIHIVAGQKPENKAIAELLVNAGASLNGALEYACTSKNFEMVKFLVKNGADIDETNSRNNTPLLSAVMAIQVELATLLLDLGANPAIEDSTGDNVLEVAKFKLKRGFSEIQEFIELLESRGDE